MKELEIQGNMVPRCNRAKKPFHPEDWHWMNYDTWEYVSWDEKERKWIPDEKMNQGNKGVRTDK